MAEPAMIALPGKLSLGEVGALHQRLLAHADDDLVVDATGVTHFGTLCLQLLIAAARDRAFSGKSFRLQNVGDAGLRQLALFGLSPEVIEGGIQ